MQDSRKDIPAKKFSFLVHTEASRAAHSWQEQVVTALVEHLSQTVTSDPNLLRSILTNAYNELAPSINIMQHYLPQLDEAIASALEALQKGWVMISKVNSERQVEELLDNEGQLRLRTPLNIFIGGQILDRGITVANLIGFYYGRRPQIYQQDTVMQHSRMFGFRPIEDLTVTRFYTEQKIYAAMRRMHESDVALRRTITSNPEQPVIFIRRDDLGTIIPCSPNKILVSNTTTLTPFKRILPVGFQTDYAVRLRKAVEKIDSDLDRLANGVGFEQPFQISITEGIALLNQIEPTLLMEKGEGFWFDWDAARAALTYLSNSSQTTANRGLIWCLVRKDRNISRKVDAGSHASYSDAPDTTRTEGKVARQIATDIPMLILLRQNGLEEKGWKGNPFYWPVIVAQASVRTAIFAHETTP